MAPVIMKPRTAVALTLALAWAAAVASVTGAPPGVVTIAADLRRPAPPDAEDGQRAPTVRVPAVFNTLTAWSPSVFDIEPLPNVSRGRGRFPYLQYIQLFTATGGCYVGFPGCRETRDLLNDPSAGLRSGVNVTRLLRPLRAIVSAGYTPHIVTGNVPIAMSVAPALGVFGFNNQPPASNADYRRYIAGVASGLVAEFGREAVARWRWGVFTEYNNADWLNASSARFFELYDHTVCGLADALGSAS